MAWQAIDTAPRDGTPVDLWVREGANAYRVPDCWHSRGKWLAADNFLGCAVEQFPHVVATHWMPVAAESFVWRDAPVAAAQRITLKSTLTHTSVI